MLLEPRWKESLHKSNDLLDRQNRNQPRARVRVRGVALAAPFG